MSKRIQEGLEMKRVLISLGLILNLLIPVNNLANAASKPVRNLPIDYADTTGPEMLKIRVDKNELNVRKKAATLKITMTVADDLNSVEGVNIYFSRLDASGKITGGKLFSSKKYIKK
jgi:hypothetical protein